jgi:hypothetical protein
MYLGATIYMSMTLKLYIDRIVAKALQTSVRAYILLKSERLSTYIKHNHYKALIRSLMIYACPTWENVATAKQSSQRYLKP